MSSQPVVRMSTLKFWAFSITLVLVGSLLGRAYEAFDLLSLASAAAIAYFLYRIVWATRDSGRFRVSWIPLVAPGGGA